MSLRSLEFAVRESLSGIRRNSLMSVAAVSSVALLLAILGTFVLTALGVNNIVQTHLDQFEMAVWMEKEVSDADLAKIKKDIAVLPNVSSAELITAEETWDKITSEWSDELELSGIEASALTHHIKVKMRHVRYTSAASDAIRKMPHVKEVVEGKELVAQVVRLADLLRIIGIAASITLFFIAAFIVSNTIRLTLYARRREIKIMQLVGATSGFVRMPFVLEGMILGIAGGGVACLLILLGSRYVSEAATRALPLLGQFSSGVDPVQFFGGIIAAGCLVGAACSLISIRRFLKA